ncbi:MAG: hypothetical protein JRJ12_09300 [Deltaproteobacteria bacterium]|nr:hypothetical protein [Deltaproteobacteria bacterium]MBW2070600.1 hypothetical protein [Deltaproteobacteria bacterium]
MSKRSKTVRIMRRIGAPEPKKIRITGILQSPDLASISFMLAAGRQESLAECLSLLGSRGINIRFISIYQGSNDETSLCICIDVNALERALELLESQSEKLGILEMIYRPEVRVISIYPYKERPRVAERLFTTLRLNGIEPLAANNASSVISCVLGKEYVDKALAFLEQAFDLP